MSELMISNRGSPGRVLKSVITPLQINGDSRLSSTPICGKTGIWLAAEDTSSLTEASSVFVVDNNYSVPIVKEIQKLSPGVQVRRISKSKQIFYGLRRRRNLRHESHLELCHLFGFSDCHKRDMEATNGSGKTAVQVGETDEKTMNGEQKTTMKIWIAVDESEGSLYALEWALKHLFLHHDVTDKESTFTVTVVHVQPPFQPTYTALPVGPVLFATSGMRESLAKAEEDSAAKILARASELCDQHQIKAEYLVLKGNPKEILVEAVEQMDVDLLVVGSRGLGHIKRAVLGSISDYCAHHAKCPVLIVRPQKA
ncbi:hypothetical protein SSX86_012642 [Deinandra increscens subsp. villosa]|uniref:UspA domain-containing protein n=1 Tax=Deinandra increscens subsp. villosa TaxID=3103831 RepID=A0AAP0DC96_9ASTR